MNLQRQSSRTLSEHLQERIRYFTSGNNYSSDAGASVGQAYNTSAYRKRRSQRWRSIRSTTLAGADSFLVRLDELESNNEISKAKLFTSNTRSGPFGARFRRKVVHLPRRKRRSWGDHRQEHPTLGILLSRLGGIDDAIARWRLVHGSEASNSPNETYDDASGRISSLSTASSTSHQSSAYRRRARILTTRRYAATSRFSTS